MGGGLDSVVTKLAAHPSRPYTPCSLQVVLRKTAHLLNPLSSLFRLNESSYEEPLGKPAVKIVGDFYDGVASSLFALSHGNLHFTDSDGAAAYPDFVDPRRGEALEVKSFGGRTVDFRDQQVKYLGDIQVTNPAWNVSYALFRRRPSPHALKTMGRSELLSFLTEGDSTAFSLRLPLSVIHHFYRLPPNTRDAPHDSPTYRYDGMSDEWTPRMRLRSSIVEALAVAPEETLARFGLNPSHYHIGRHTVAPLFYAGNPLASFPLIQISDTKDAHARWVHDFRAAYPDNLEPSFSSRPSYQPVADVPVTDRGYIGV